LSAGQSVWLGCGSELRSRARESLLTSVTVLPTATRMKFGLTLPFAIVIVFVSTGPVDVDVGDVGESPLQETAITTAAGSTTVQTRCFQLGTDVLQTLAAPRGAA
jgi:hypothetical protein